MSSKSCNPLGSGTMDPRNKCAGDDSGAAGQIDGQESGLARPLRTARPYISLPSTFTMKA